MQAGYTVPKYFKQGRQTSYVVDKGIGIRNFWSNDTWNRLYFLISSWCDNITWVFPKLILRVDVNITECQVSMSTACRIFTKVTRQIQNAGLFSIYFYFFWMVVVVVVNGVMSTAATLINCLGLTHFATSLILLQVAICIHF